MQRDRVRPDPVSCQSCRSKKLKCNRVQPCSNCATRGITCNFLVPPPVKANTTSSIHSNTDILTRIERLESIILKQTSSTEPHLSKASNDIYVTRQQPLNFTSQRVPIYNVHQNRDQDSRLLENIGTREDALLSRLSNGLVFKICSVHEIIRSSSDDQLSDTMVTLPAYQIAALLLLNYESNVDHLCRITHLPTTKSLLKSFYLRVIQNESVLPGEAALLLSICALSAYFYLPFDKSEVASTKQGAVNLSKVLSKSALDVLDYSRRNTSGTLEDVQAHIYMSFVTYHLDGFSARGRLLSTTAISIARELRLHRLDAEDELSNNLSDEENKHTICFFIDREIKRRVFWHIVSTDWLFSCISGPQEGTYFIHPNHISVKLPKDWTDEDLALGEEHTLAIGPQPTGMTYFLERVRLAHLCREMADIVPQETSKLMQIPYEQIIALDKKLQDFIANLPFFFKLDAESRRKTKPLESMFDKLAVSRYCITTELYTRRCKLHQRFLLRQSIDPRYSYSRQACLESARVVVHVYGNLREYNLKSTVPELMGLAVHFTHLALVVMVMDLCFNRGEVDEAGIKAELKDALQMFENTSNASPLLGRLLSSLSDVLKKHKVRLDDPSIIATNNTTSYAPGIIMDASSNPFSDIQMQSSQFEFDIQDSGLTLDNSFDEFWQIAMQTSSNLDSLSWDNLFSTLDSRPL